MGTAAPSALLLAVALTNYLCCQGVVVTPQPANTSTPEPNVTFSVQDELCLRIHNNTAFLGAEPFTKLLLYSASDCRRNCVELYPKCVAAMFYFLHGERKNHICYLFDKNSINEDVALVAERPRTTRDVIRTLEIVPNCHDFDAFPPLEDPFITSSDTITKGKRSFCYDCPPRVTGPWTSWSPCNGRTMTQVRSQGCEYGRSIQRRRCAYPWMLGMSVAAAGTSGPAALSTSASVTIGNGASTLRFSSVGTHISAPYPPTPYVHPGCDTEEYSRIMAQHADQVQASCCNRMQYQQQHQVSPVVTRPCSRPCGSVVGGLPAYQAYPVEQPVEVVVQPQPAFPVVVQPQPVVAQPQPAVVAQPQPMVVAQPQPVVVTQPQPVVVTQPQPVVVTQPQPVYTAPVVSVPSYVPPPPPPPPKYIPTLPPPPPKPAYRPEIVVSPAVWSSWSEWSFCSATCDIGSEQRYRSCSNRGCQGASVEQRRCENLQPCNTWSTWSEWSACSATCAIGRRSRSRFCHLGSAYCSGEDFEVEDCDSGPCAEWGIWGEWSACSATCGYGVHRRYRSCQGIFCAGDASQERSCDLPDCSHWAEWQEWSFCSVSCGEGTMSRRRLCMGNDCEGQSEETDNCARQPCPSWTEWETWSLCSVSCGFGSQRRLRSCLGNFCPGSRVEEVECEMPACSFWSQWQEWSQCSASCNSGMKHRTRNCVYGSDCVGSDEETVYCDSGVPCVQWAPWGTWTRCSKECGLGEKSRRRECVTGEDYPSQGCRGDAIDTVTCVERACCAWTPWTSWSNCDRDCDGGRMTRTRMCQRPGPSNETCHCVGDDREHLTCNERACVYPTVWKPVPTLPPPPPPPRVYPTWTYVPPPPPPDVSQPTLPPPPPPPPSRNITWGVYPTWTYATPPPERPREVQYPTRLYPIAQQQPSCQWTDWCTWSPCQNNCDYSTTRRHRQCVGDTGCMCHGFSVEEASCPTLDACTPAVRCDDCEF